MTGPVEQIPLQTYNADRTPHPTQPKPVNFTDQIPLQFKIRNTTSPFASLGKISTLIVFSSHFPLTYYSLPRNRGE